MRMFARIVAVAFIIFLEVANIEADETDHHIEDAKNDFSFSVGPSFNLALLWGDRDQPFLVQGMSLDFNYYTETWFYAGIELYAGYFFMVPPLVFLKAGYQNRIHELVIIEANLKIGMLTSDPGYIDLGGGVGVVLILHRGQKAALSIKLDLPLTCTGVADEEPLLEFRPGLGLLVLF